MDPPPKFPGFFFSRPNLGMQASPRKGWNVCDQIRNKLASPSLHFQCLLDLVYTQNFHHCLSYTQFNSLLTVTQIYASDEAINVKAVKYCPRLKTNFLPCPKSRWTAGENCEIFINWYYLGEAGIGYMNVCTKPMQTNQYINIDQ